MSDYTKNDWEEMLAQYPAAAGPVRLSPPSILDPRIRAYFWARLWGDAPELFVELRALYERQVEAHGEYPDPPLFVTRGNNTFSSGDFDVCQRLWIRDRGPIETTLRRYNLATEYFTHSVFRLFCEHFSDEQFKISNSLDDYEARGPSFLESYGIEIERLDLGSASGFDPITEDEDSYTDRVLMEVRGRIKDHCANVRARIATLAEASQVSEKKRRDEFAKHVQWLIRYQVNGERTGSIAKSAGVSSSNVSKHVRAIAAAIPLPIRDQDTGRTPGSKNAHNLGLRRHKAPGK